MTKVILIDTNIFIRHLRGDDKILSPKAKLIFEQAELGKHQIYVDEVVVAEVIWVLTSYYKETRENVKLQLTDIISQDWIINPRKKLILKTLSFYANHSVSYIDCWALIVAKNKQLPLVTFDKTLDKLTKSS